MPTTEKARRAGGRPRGEGRALQRPAGARPPRRFSLRLLICLAALLAVFEVAAVASLGWPLLLVALVGVCLLFCVAWPLSALRGFGALKKAAARDAGAPGIEEADQGRTAAPRSPPWRRWSALALVAASLSYALLGLGVGAGPAILSGLAAFCLTAHAFRPRREAPPRRVPSIAPDGMQGHPAGIPRAWKRRTGAAGPAAILLVVSLSAAPGFAALGVSDGPPDLVDGPDTGSPPAAALDLTAAWVGNDTRENFSVFMQVKELATPPEANLAYHYHFHFQVDGADRGTRLYHAIAHRSRVAWGYEFEEWLSSGNTGSWGSTRGTEGAVDLSQGAIEVKVQKAWIENPLTSGATGTFRVDRFYVHADEVDEASGQVTHADTLPDVGTAGSHDLAALRGPADFALIALPLGGLAVAAILLIVAARARGARR